MLCSPDKLNPDPKNEESLFLAILSCQALPKAPNMRGFLPAACLLSGQDILKSTSAITMIYGQFGL